MRHIQEYYSPTGTGKSHYFIPFQMFINSLMGCDNFLIIGMSKGVEKRYKEICRKQLGLFRYLFKKNRKHKIKFLDITQFVVERNHETLVQQIVDFLATSTFTTNVVIDEIDFLTRDNDDVLNHLKYHFKCKVLTMVGQVNDNEFRKLNFISHASN
ncbi:MAG TPA: hypothetical protein VGQ59_02940 [Cyclobacteriaceae bacterium]|jgi:thymidine kinase|nr:hypothetical protein [Cyclobacteriaceae bacterium]